MPPILNDAIHVAGISHFVPPRVVSNQEIIDARGLRMKASWIEKNIGIRERRWANSDVCASDLAVSASKNLVSKDFSGSIWVSTISQDYFTPSTSSIVKGKLGLLGDSPCFDVSAACAGHLFALQSAWHLLQSTEETEALVIATEVRSRFLNPKDRRTVFLFGDGAAAILLRKGAHAQSPGIEWVECATRSSLEHEILVPAGGSAYPSTAEAIAEGAQFIRMNNGASISDVTTTTLVDELLKKLAQKKRNIADYDYFVFHQGNASIARQICERIGVDPKKSWSNFERFGNTSGASLGIALSEAHSLGKISPGSRILLMAMGAGYHFGIASLRWTLGGVSK